MSNLKEIEARHKRDRRLTIIATTTAPEWAVDALADRAVLLAEVNRFKALCKRALKELREDEPSSIGPERKPLMAELKEAAKK